MFYYLKANILNYASWKMTIIHVLFNIDEAWFIFLDCKTSIKLTLNKNIQYLISAYVQVKFFQHQFKGFLCHLSSNGLKQTTESSSTFKQIFVCWILKKILILDYWILLYFYYILYNTWKNKISTQRNGYFDILQEVLIQEAISWTYFQPKTQHKYTLFNIPINFIPSNKSILNEK